MKSVVVCAYSSLFSFEKMRACRCCVEQGGGRTLAIRARKSKTVIDGLSGPLAIAHMILRWAAIKTNAETGTVGLQTMETDKPLHVVVIGATAAYEEASFSCLYVIPITVWQLFDSELKQHDPGYRCHVGWRQAYASLPRHPPPPALSLSRARAQGEMWRVITASEGKGSFLAFFFPSSSTGQLFRV